MWWCWEQQRCCCWCQALGEQHLQLPQPAWLSPRTHPGGCCRCWWVLPWQVQGREQGQPLLLLVLALVTRQVTPRHQRW
jgi:hypothetical protein